MASAAGSEITVAVSAPADRMTTFFTPAAGKVRTTRGLGGKSPSDRGTPQPSTANQNTATTAAR